MPNKTRRIELAGLRFPYARARKGAVFQGILGGLRIGSPLACAPATLKPGMLNLGFVQERYPARDMQITKNPACLSRFSKRDLFSYGSDHRGVQI
jgi:hypothetical protein